VRDADGYHGREDAGTLRRHGRSTVTWHAENGSISAANPTFEARTLTARTAVVRCQGSLELSQDSPNFGTQLAQVMTRAMAAEIDKAGLVGAGAPHPRGSGGRPAWAPSPASAPGGLQRSARRRAGSAGGQRAVGGGDRERDHVAAHLGHLRRARNGYHVRQEPAAPAEGAGEHDLPAHHGRPEHHGRLTRECGEPDLPGDFSQLVLGVRQESAVEVLKLTTFASNLLLEFVGYTRLDFMVARPASFVVLDGVTVSS